MRYSTVGKSKDRTGEISREQRFVKENQALKRENSRLRKLLARIDLDRYDQVREIIEEHYSERKNEGQEILDKMKEEWRCHQCRTGLLEIFLFNKINETYYYRKCNGCTNRTKSKKYTPSVRGIIKKEESK